jgi:hypothetical protein
MTPEEYAGFDMDRELSSTDCSYFEFVDKCKRTDLNILQSNMVNTSTGPGFQIFYQFGEVFYDTPECDDGFFVFPHTNKGHTCHKIQFLFTG